MNLILFAAILFIPATVLQSAEPVLTGHLEYGFLSVLSHKVQFGNDGTYFPYHEEGNQNTLFSIARMSLDWRLSDRSSLVFLYQPLALETRAVLRRDIRIDAQDFTNGTPMRFNYEFPFYRVSYLYDLDPHPQQELAIGISFQLRNAVIEFASLDGTRLRANRNVGPVPILKFRWRRSLPDGFWFGAEADGFYAPVSYINGSDTEVTGAILDASLRAGYALADGKAFFVNLRYLGGGAVGTSEDPDDFGDGYVRNWLHFLTVTVGVSMPLL
jgi:hypothetical protein